MCVVGERRIATWLAQFLQSPCAVDHWSLKKLESPEHSSNSGFTGGRLTELQLDVGGEPLFCPFFWGTQAQVQKMSGICSRA